MATSATMNGQRPVEESVAGVGENVAGLAHDLLSLADLQLKLLVLDVQESSARALTPAAMLLGGACLALGGMPVLLLGLGGMLAMWTSWPAPVAYLIVAVAAMVIGAVLVWLSATRLQKAFEVLGRSRTELNDNIAWIKKVIQQTSFSKQH